MQLFHEDPWWWVYWEPLRTRTVFWRHEKNMLAKDVQLLTWRVPSLIYIMRKYQPWGVERLHQKRDLVVWLYIRGLYDPLESLDQLTFQLGMPNIVDGLGSVCFGHMTTGRGVLPAECVNTFWHSTFTTPVHSPQGPPPGSPGRVPPSLYDISVAEFLEDKK